tara:strand:+ start:530 stop:700 length:171 start_codon:yes stop_codon:yes gene_type:complete
MVASSQEAKEISEVILSYIPQRDAQDLMNEVWNKIGQHSDNESLQQTILILKKLMD